MGPRTAKTMNVLTDVPTQHELLDAYRLAGNPQALGVLTRAAGWIAFRVDHLTPEQMEASLQMEFECRQQGPA